MARQPPPPPPPPKLNKAAPISTRATATKKRDKRDIPYIRPLPKKSESYGFWKIFPFEKEDAPDNEEVDDKLKVPPHPYLKPDWENINNEKFIHLFNGPSVDYSPVKLISKDVMFKDHDDVSFYLIHLFIYSLNNIIIYQK